MTNRAILKAILQNIEQANLAAKLFPNELTVFATDKMFYSAVKVPIQEIEYLLDELSPELLELIADIPRTTAEENIGAAIINLWDTYQNDLPRLKNNIESLLSMNYPILNEAAH
jgi:uncharacterized protein with HEPN domain